MKTEEAAQLNLRSVDPHPRQPVYSVHTQTAAIDSVNTTTKLTQTLSANHVTKSVQTAKGLSELLKSKGTNTDERFVFPKRNI